METATTKGNQGTRGAEPSSKRRKQMARNMTSQAAVAPRVEPIPHFAGSEYLYVKKPEDLTQAFNDADRVRSIKSVYFGRDVGIQDEHLDLLSSQLRGQLVKLELGDSDTGDGVRITPQAIKRLAQRCPNLRGLRLESVTSADDSCMDVLFECCPQLQELTVTGHDRSGGAVTNKSVKKIAEGSLPNLQKLVLTDQWKLGYDNMMKLQKKRRGLRVLAGDTDGDSMASQMVMQMMGRTYGDNLYGNMRGRSYW